jgi:hypothetical protein
MTHKPQHNVANIFNVRSIKLAARRNYDKIPFCKVCCHLLQNCGLSKPKNYTIVSYEFLCNLFPQLTHQTHFYIENDGEETKRTFELHRCCQGRVKCVYSRAVFCADQTLSVRRAALCGNETCIESAVLMCFMEVTQDM